MKYTHYYQLSLQWTGNAGAGTAHYHAYRKDHTICIQGKPLLQGSSDPHFRGDPSRYNPEELLLASLSACHMLWYLHLCAEAGVVVMAYEDEATASMEENQDGSGQFAEAVLHPVVSVAEDAMVEQARQLHHKAHQMCFIARSVNFPVRHQPKVITATKKT